MGGRHAGRVEAPGAAHKRPSTQPPPAAVGSRASAWSWRPSCGGPRQTLADPRPPHAPPAACPNGALLIDDLLQRQPRPATKAAAAGAAAIDAAQGPRHRRAGRHARAWLHRIGAAPRRGAASPARQTSRSWSVFGGRVRSPSPKVPAKQASPPMPSSRPKTRPRAIRLVAGRAFRPEDVGSWSKGSRGMKMERISDPLTGVV